MRKCVISEENKEYDEESEFASYVLQKKDYSRSLIFQFVRGKGDEQFNIVNLTLQNSTPLAATSIATKQEFFPSCAIATRKQVEDLIAEEGSAYALNIVPKAHLEVIISTFEAIGIIQSSNAAKAFNTLCEPVKKMTGIEINPVELACHLAQAKKAHIAQGRDCCIQ
jgi:hypothetical protein